MNCFFYGFLFLPTKDQRSWENPIGSEGDVVHVRMVNKFKQIQLCFANATPKHTRLWDHWYIYGFIFKIEFPSSRNLNVSFTKTFLINLCSKQYTLCTQEILSTHGQMINIWSISNKIFQLRYQMFHEEKNSIEAWAVEHV